jgi:predicted nucleic acid-binding protein
MSVVFLDANIFLDALLKRNEHENAGAILDKANPA